MAKPVVRRSGNAAARRNLGTSSDGEKLRKTQCASPSKRMAGGAGNAWSYWAARPYRKPAMNSTSAHAPVKYIRNGDGKMNHAINAAAADNPPVR